MKSKYGNGTRQGLIKGVLSLPCSFFKAGKTTQNKNCSGQFRGLCPFLAQKGFLFYFNNHNSVRSYKNFFILNFYLNCIKYIFLIRKIQVIISSHSNAKKVRNMRNLF